MSAFVRELNEFMYFNQGRLLPPSDAVKRSQWEFELRKQGKHIPSLYGLYVMAAERTALFYFCLHVYDENGNNFFVKVRAYDLRSAKLMVRPIGGCLYGYEIPKPFQIDNHNISQFCQGMVNTFSNRYL